MSIESMMPSNHLILCSLLLLLPSIFVCGCIGLCVNVIVHCLYHSIFFSILKYFADVHQLSTLTSFVYKLYIYLCSCYTILLTYWPLRDFAWPIVCSNTIRLYLNRVIILISFYVNIGNLIIKFCNIQ